MPRMNLPVKPETLRWARGVAGYPHVDDAVQAISHLSKRADGHGELMAWESGDSPIGKTTATALAKAYDLPLPYLYLPVDTVHGLVPDVTQIHDFRMAPDRRLTPNLIRYLRSVMSRQERLRDILEDDDIPDPSWIGSGAGADAKELGAAVRRQLLTDNQQPKDLKDWIRLIEDRLGVAVMQSRTHHTHKPEAHFSGVALSDHAVPVIAVNSDELPARRIFTLLHELVHLFIGEPGISRVVFDSGVSVPDTEVERFCNEVAAEILMPREAFLNSWTAEIATGGGITAAVRRLVSDTGASYSAVAVRAAKLGRISDADLGRLLAEYDSFYKLKRRQQAENIAKRKAEGHPVGGIAQKVVALGRVGPRMTRKALIAYDEGRISSMDLYDIFGVKLNHLPNIAEQVDHHLVRWHGALDSG